MCNALKVVYDDYTCDEDKSNNCNVIDEEVVDDYFEPTLHNRSKNVNT